MKINNNRNKTNDKKQIIVILGHMTISDNYNTKLNDNKHIRQSRKLI